MDGGEDDSPESSGLVAISDEEYEDLNEYEDDGDQVLLQSMDQKPQRVRPKACQVGIAPAQFAKNNKNKAQLEKKMEEFEAEAELRAGKVAGKTNKERRKQFLQRIQEKKKEKKQKNVRKKEAQKAMKAAKKAQKLPNRNFPPDQFYRPDPLMDCPAPRPLMECLPPPQNFPPPVPSTPAPSEILPPHLLAQIHFSMPQEYTDGINERKQTRINMKLSKKDAMHKLKQYIEANPGACPTDDIPGINDGLSLKQRRAAVNSWGPIAPQEGCVLIHPAPFTDVNSLTRADLLPHEPHKWQKRRVFALLNKLRGIPLEQMTLMHCETIYQLAVLCHVKLDASIRSLRARLKQPQRQPKEDVPLPASCFLLFPPPLTDPKDITPEDMDIDELKRWSVEKQYAVVNKLRGIPLDQLTVDHCTVLFRVAKKIHVKLEEFLVERRDKLFLDQKVAQYLEKMTAEAATVAAGGVTPLSQEDLLKRAMSLAVADETPFTVQKKKRFDYIPDYYADCGEYRTFTPERKWALFNALRAIPLEELDRQSCHKIVNLASHMKVSLSAAFLQRREELIGKKPLPSGAFGEPGAVPNPPPTAPRRMIGPQLPEPPANQYPPVNFQDVAPGAAGWRHPQDVDLRRQQPQLNRPPMGPPPGAHPYDHRHMEQGPVEPYYDHHHYRQEGPMDPYYDRPYVEGSGEPYYDQYAQEWHYYDGPPRGPGMNPIAFSNPTPPPPDTYNDPYGDCESYHHPGVQWNEGNTEPARDEEPYPSEDVSNYPHRQWMRQQQVVEQWERLDQQIQQQRQQERMEQGVRRPNGQPHPAWEERREERPQKRVTYPVGRSPSPKRRREESPHRYGEAPSLQPAGVKVQLSKLANSEQYVLEEPEVKIETIYRQPVTVQDMQAASDLVYLCQFRDAPAVTQPFVHPASRVILSYICEYLGDGFSLQEFSSSKQINLKRPKIPDQRVRSQAAIWIGGLSRIITLGEGVDVEQGQATKFAYASAMAALCYMMIVPYQLFLVVKNSGPTFVDIILQACKPRIRHMIAVSREPVFGPLATYKGGLEVPDHIRDIWGTFINRMRHSGVDMWESNVIPVPRHTTGFTGATIPDFHFKCEQDGNYDVSWADMVPVPGEDTTSFAADFNRTSACSRFIQAPCEKGIIPYMELPCWLDSPYSYDLKHKIPHVNPKKYDPILHLPFRDLLYNFGIGSRSTPRFTLYFLKLIGARWNRNLVVQHKLEIDVKDQKERWKHVVSLSFEGVPCVFLGGRCRRDTFASALIHAGSIIAEQLSNLMIIPQELCYLVQKQARAWGAIVIYVCRERFAAFEALVRNTKFVKLHSVASATLDFKNPLYKLAESFFWRMRSTGYPYWVDHRKRLMVPVAFGEKPTLSEDAFFTFDSIYQNPAWESINAAQEHIDYFDDSVLKIEDRQWTVWEGGDRGQELMPAPQPPQASAAAASPGTWFENALDSDYNMPLTSLSFPDCKMVLKLLRALAAASTEKGLELKVAKSLTATGHELFRCDVSWGGALSWFLKASFDSFLERDIEFGAGWELYRMLIKMAIVPPGLFEFLVNNEARLPYVVSSLVPFIWLLGSILPQFLESTHGLLLEDMKRRALAEWLSCKIQLPPQLIPNSEEQRRLPFVLVEEMSPRTQEIWDATYGLELAGVMEESGHHVDRASTQLRKAFGLPEVKPNPPQTQAPMKRRNASAAGTSRFQQNALSRASRFSPAS